MSFVMSRHSLVGGIVASALSRAAGEASLQIGGNVRPLVALSAEVSSVDLLSGVCPVSVALASESDQGLREGSFTCAQLLGPPRPRVSIHTRLHNQSLAATWMHHPQLRLLARIRPPS